MQRDLVFTRAQFTKIAKDEISNKVKSWMRMNRAAHDAAEAVWPRRNLSSMHYSYAMKVAYTPLSELEQAIREIRTKLTSESREWFASNPPNPTSYRHHIVNLQDKLESLGKYLEDGFQSIYETLASDREEMERVQDDGIVSYREEPMDDDQ